MKPITDKAEVSVDFPDKAYMGVFGRDSGFEVKAEADATLIRLVHPGEDRRVVDLHLHHHLLADLIDSMAERFRHTAVEEVYRSQLLSAAERLAGALNKKP
ncbi:MAG: hypothetical protein HQ481_09710 [Alphaproteobacteria bacterium]|nr:hypothetical protein [Alphaproteobacteria bacterium]